MSAAPELDDVLHRVFKAPKLIRINGFGKILNDSLPASAIPNAVPSMNHIPGSAWPLW